MDSNIRHSGPINTPSAYNSTVTVLSNGNYQFEWAITRNACTITRDTVNISILKTTTTANAGSDQIICGTTTTLAGNVYFNRIDSWSWNMDSCEWFGWCRI